MLEVIPAIDLKDGLVVNLKQGKFDQSTVYSEDPVETAGRWVEQGATRLHIVDLDGALEGKNVSQSVVVEIAQRFPRLTLQVGGGIRSQETIEAYLAAGVDYLVLGTKAVEMPEFVGEMCQAFPGKMIVGLDGLNGKVAIQGWKVVTDHKVTDLARQFEQVGIAAIIYTDINRDGMMGGINLLATVALSETVKVPIIASGGINTLSDIEALVKLPSRSVGGITGVITGRAIYEGTMDLRAAITLSQAP